MSQLELKGGILEMIAKIDDLESLKALNQLITDFVGNHLKDTDYWEELSDIESNELEIAIEESEDEANHVSHEEVMKKYLR